MWQEADLPDNDHLSEPRNRHPPALITSRSSSPLKMERVGGTISAASPSGWDNLNMCSTQQLRVSSGMGPHVHRNNQPLYGLHWLPSLLGLTFSLHCWCFLSQFPGSINYLYSNSISGSACEETQILFLPPHSSLSPPPAPILSSLGEDGLN